MPPDARPPELTGKGLLSATYLNELLVLLLHRNDVHEALFGEYHETLYGLSQASGLEVTLRNFEKHLLIAHARGHVDATAGTAPGAAAGGHDLTVGEAKHVAFLHPMFTDLHERLAPLD